MKIEMPNAPEMADTAQRYLERLSATLRASTIGTYATPIRNLFSYLAEIHPEVKSFRDIHRSPHIEGYLRHLASRYRSNATRRETLMSLRRFFSDMQRWDWPEAPTEYLIDKEDIPSRDQYLPRPLSPETDRVIRNTLKHDDSLYSQALLLLRLTGLRIGELLNLQLDCIQDLSPGRWTLRVPIGKLHSERVVPLSDEALESFNRIRELRGNPQPILHPETKVPTSFLLMRPNGKRVSYSSLRKKLTETAISAGVTEHITPHRLRHSFATELLSGGMGIVGIKTLLGHQSIGMTLRYAAVCPIHLYQEYHDAIEKAHLRYGMLESSPSSSVKRDRAIAPASILDDLRDISTRLETYRRDHASSPCAKRLQRLGERLQRLISDISSCLIDS